MQLGIDAATLNEAFDVRTDALFDAVRMLSSDWPSDARAALAALPLHLPEDGAGDQEVLARLAAIVLGGAQRLDGPLSFAHMDPPTPWLTWATTLWNARLNQNLLHPATAPMAREVEERVIAWLAPSFGMDGGHMVPGSTIANLTAIWAARETQGRP